MSSCFMKLIKQRDSRSGNILNTLSKKEKMFDVLSEVLGNIKENITFQTCPCALQQRDVSKLRAPTLLCGDTCQLWHLGRDVPISEPQHLLTLARPFEISDHLFSESPRKSSYQQYGVHRSCVCRGVSVWVCERESS